MPRRTLSTTEKARMDFVSGKTDTWKAGGYGSTVEVWADGGKLKIRSTKPKRRQKTYFDEDTRDRRRELAEIASALAAKVRHPDGRRPRGERRAPITVREVWLLYIRDNWPGIPDRVISGGRREVHEYYASVAKLPEAQRKQVLSAGMLLSVTQCMRRVMGYEAYRPDRSIREIEPADWKNYTMWRLGQKVPRGDRHYAAGTIETDYRKFHAAIHHCMKQRPERWGNHRDPLVGATVVKADPKQIPELGEETARAMLGVLKRKLGRKWRAYASMGIGLETARRISEIGPDSVGVGADTLCAGDFRRGDDGRLYVTFRVETLKGGNFGRGDLTIPATRALEVLHRWLTWFHPNPLGPSAPLIWSKADPTRPVSYAAVHSHFVSTWKELHDGQAPPLGLSFHGICRTVITTLVDEIGLEKTAEFVGRSVKTIERIYKRVRPETQCNTADALDRVRGRRGRK